MRQRWRDSSEMTAINVTPIIDVALVLVIILMLTAPMMTTPPLSLSLPQARSRSQGEQPHMSVTISREGSVAIDQTVVPREAVLRELTARMTLREEDDRLLIIRADEGVEYASVRQIVSEARQAGATRVAIATRPRAQGGS